MRSPRPTLLGVLLLGALLLCSSCHVQRIDPAEIPVVRIQTTGGFEHGVSTQIGVLFLGRTASEGPAKLQYWLGPTPMIETGQVEAIGGSIHRIRPEVPIPSVPVTLEPVRPDEELVLMGIQDQIPWRLPVQLAQDEVVRGTVLRYPAGLRLGPDSVGLGVFRETDAGFALVGLVKGVAQKSDDTRFLLFAGIGELRDAFARSGRAVEQLEVEYRADGKRILRYKR
jgi:hypothetical protein